MVSSLRPGVHSGSSKQPGFLMVPYLVTDYFARAGILFGLLLVELLVLSVSLDGQDLARQGGLAGLIGVCAPLVARIGVAFIVIFGAFGFRNAGSALRALSSETAVHPISWALLAMHFGSLIAFGILSQRLFGSPGPHSYFVTTSWLLCGGSLLAFAGCAFVPWHIWRSLFRVTGWLWLLALGAGISSVAIGSAISRLWAPMAKVTFRLVGILLHPFLSDLISDPAKHTLGTSKFQVAIANECSGLEGIGLMLVFGSLWLWFFRREWQFPRAIILLPLGILVLWIANAVRIAALILIGNSGFPGVAAGGFHSQAGWITFNAVALGFCLATGRFAGRTQTNSPAEILAQSSATPWLLPFLAIIAAGMLARAASSGFEWLYPIRFIAGAGVLWVYRAKYKSLDWHFGWIAPVVGVVVFALWMVLDRVMGADGNSRIASGLATLPVWGQLFWLTIRTLASVTTVPVSEELAFRGFLIRRLTSADFESLGPQTFTWVSLLVSSLAFGLFHGDRWIAGTLAGLMYAGVFLRRGRMGDAVLAHATTNALLAALVLFTGKWSLWGA